MLRAKSNQENPRDLPQNIQSSTTTSPEETVLSAQLDQTHLPKTSIPADSLDQAKNILMRQHFGIVYGDVLKSLVEKSFCLSEYPHKDSLDLTRKLLELHPRLAGKHQALALSEGFIDYALALIPVVGRPLPSTEFLKANKGINQVVEDLEEGGLVRVNHFVGGSSGLDASMTGVGSSFFVLSPTELGVLALRTL